MLRIALRWWQEFISAILEQHEKQKTERAEWQAAMTQATREKDEQARTFIIALDSLKKQVFREIREEPGLASSKLSGPRVSHGLRVSSRLRFGTSVRERLPIA